MKNLNLILFKEHSYRLYSEVLLTRDLTCGMVEIIDLLVLRKEESVIQAEADVDSRAGRQI